MADEMTPQELENLELENRLLQLKINDLERDDRKRVAEGDQTGRFMFVSVVDDVPVYNLILRLENYATRNPGAPIEIVMNSPGGNVIDGLGLVDYLRELSARGHKITIKGSGLVASMAATCFAVADERVFSKHAWMILHEVRGGAEGTLTDQGDTVKWYTRMQDQVVDILCERSTLTPRTLKNRWKRKDIYLSAEDALKLELIDRIEA